MVISANLPSVLQRPHGNSLSMERSLKQIKELLEVYPVDLVDEDMLRASIDDCEDMLAAINRGE